MPAWRLLAAVAALVGYALLSNWLMVHAPDRAWTVAALFGPPLAAVAATGWKRRHRPTLALCAAAALVLAWIVARGGVADARRMYLLQHAGVHFLLAASFAMTLRAGSKPLITAVAERVHVVFTAEMRAYTRWLTGLWVVYFCAMVVVSLTIYTLASWEFWSLYCNVLTPLAALTLAAGEHLVRYVRHPEFERASLTAAVRAYRALRAADAR